jgi:hypothetical protein
LLRLSGSKLGLYEGVVVLDDVFELAIVMMPEVV